MNKMLRALALLTLAAPLWAQPISVQVDGVVAQVGKEIILQSDIAIQRDALAREGQTLTDCQMIRELLLEKLLIHHAAIDSVIIAEEEVDENIDRRIDQLVGQIGTERRLEEYYGKTILEIKEEMRPLMRNQMTAQRMQMTITETIEVTPKEVEDAVALIPLDSLPLIGTEVELAQIIIEPKVSPQAEQDAIDRLNQLRDRILGGSSFATMAILYSEDPGSNRNGGEYKGIKRGIFVKEFEAIAFNLRPGEVSAPFRTEYGFHIVQLQVKRGEELDFRHILIKPKVEQADLDAAKNTLDSLRSAILAGSITFEKVAETYSADEESKLNGGVMMNPMTTDVRWNVENLDRGIFYAIEKIQPGEISEPALVRKPDGQEIFRILQLRDRVAPHRANLAQDFSLLKNYVQNQRKQAKMLQWVEDKKAETYIFQAPGYEGCWN
ncbi:MAG: peptidylprolyl isomerase [Bacteroidetes bacterium]|nr:peptidylprolyl isomerase [Bacteroidota bacterium]MDA0829105.1 peptidylprolyl isomerase [Bacteroidota bacterium]MDA1199296.1 peptidylprolyl isomerase [Bacteroidota bacterium]